MDSRAQVLDRLLGLPRLLLSLTIFLSFFLVSGLLCLLALPRLLFGRPGPRAQRRYRRGLNLGFHRFMAMLRAFHLIDFRLPERRPDHPQGAFLVIANHPTLLDVALLLSACPEAVCLVKSDWYRSPFLRPLLLLGDHIPGSAIEEFMPGSTSPAPVVERIEQKLREGVPVVVFPEGTRSPRRGLRRFRRGALEAATRAGVPVVQVFLDVDRPFLMKGQPLWQMPTARVRYHFEWLGHVDVSTSRDSRALASQLRRHYQTRLAQIPEGR
ncbi:MAG: 1-acyl-sn-glycerol-3-phosphate acyltransferase [Deltaproteobacteria bacterium]|nr:1-acyl-sn-glycerol-3-phosphate acyltransferase [Deltaproteobacteria bacterium]